MNEDRPIEKLPINQIEIATILLRARAGRYCVVRRMEAKDVYEMRRNEAEKHGNVEHGLVQDMGVCHVCTNIGKVYVAALQISRQGQGLQKESAWTHCATGVDAEWNAMSMAEKSVQAKNE